MGPCCVQIGGQDQVKCPWLLNDCSCLPWHLGLDILPRRREAFPGQCPRFKSSTRPAISGGLCQRWRAGLLGKGFPESQGSPPELSGPARSQACLSPEGRLKQPVPLERRVPCLEEARFSNLSHTARLIVTQGSEKQAVPAGMPHRQGLERRGEDNYGICFPIKCVSGGKD